MKKLLALVSMFVFLVSCSHAKLLKEFQPHKVPAGLSLETIEKTIIVAGQNRGWIIKKIDGKNALKANLIVRQHSVELLIPYSLEEYNTLYSNSRNLNYDAKRNTIHKSYFRWVNFLQQDIDRALLLATAYAK